MINNAISVNPYDQKTIFQHPYIHADHIASIATRSEQGSQVWSQITIENRALYLKAIAQAIKNKLPHYALLATQEMGKPITQSKAELEKCIVALEYYAHHSSEILQGLTVPTNHKYSHIHFEPIGTVLAVMPWNFPYWQVFRVMGPILMGGNAMILKHASNVSQCALAIAEIMKEAQIPEGVFQTVIMTGKDVASLLAQPAVQAVTFTGSTEVGKIIAQNAGKYIKKQVLELGGSDAYIVCADANIDEAVSALVHSRLNNAGQSCIGAKRFIVLADIYEEFLAKTIQEMETYKLEHPELETCKLGPMQSVKARNELHEQVLAALAGGAVSQLGAYLPDESAAYYPPTLLTNISKDNPAYSQEFFGPVALLFQAQNIEEAIQIANDTPFGLGGGIFTQNEEEGLRIGIKMLKAGSIAVNSCVSSDPRMPFGGIKESGYGRELHHFGLMEFVNIKSVVLHE